MDIICCGKGFSKLTIDGLKKKILADLKNCNNKKDMSDEEYLKIDKYKNELEGIDDLVKYMMDEFDDIYDCENLMDLIFEQIEVEDSDDLYNIVCDVSIYGVSHLYYNGYELSIWHSSLDVSTYEREYFTEQYECLYSDKVDEIFGATSNMAYHMKELWVDIECENSEMFFESQNYGNWQIIEN